MISYLRRAREHKEFLLKETKEFERGKRHLANMMGVESQQMTQADIDDAINYLFPSGLFDKRARPMMKHPELLFKAQKEAQFDVEGRPYHHLFYTTKPNYYENLSALSKLIRELNDFEDERLAEGILDPPEESKYTLSGRAWLTYDQLKDKFIEALDESDYAYFIRCLEHLTKHPYSMRAKSFIEEYSNELPDQTINLSLPELLHDETTGQIYTDIVQRHEQQVVRIKTILNGTGKIDIDGSDILYFEHPYVRTGLLSPLKLAGMQDKVDIFANLIGKSKILSATSVAICIRQAVSDSIAAYVDDVTRERLRLAGLLTKDFRNKERKKFGQMKARRKYTWKKR